MSLLNLILRRTSAPLGRRGEDLAAKFLRRRGFRILQRNLPLVDDEADLVALDPDGRTIVIVEVKTRSGDGNTHPELAITRTKQFRQARLASRLQQSRDYQNCPFRFDAVAVVIPQRGKPAIRHFPGAFESPW
jgi:putative endonuclease